MPLSGQRVLGLVTSVLLALNLAGCEKPPEDNGKNAPREVSTLRIKTEPFTGMAQLPGPIEPVRVAEVRARVAGIVLKRKFSEAAHVEAEEVLFQIDPAPFNAAFSRAQGDLARVTAQVSQTQANVRRY